MDEWCNEKRERMFVVELLTWMTCVLLRWIVRTYLCASMYAALLKRLHHIDGCT